MSKEEPEESFLRMTATEMWREFREDSEKVDNRLRRLEIVVALIAVYAMGQGGGAILSRFGL